MVEYTYNNKQEGITRKNYLYNVLSEYTISGMLPIEFENIEVVREEHEGLLSALIERDKKEV